MPIAAACRKKMTKQETQETILAGLLLTGLDDAAIGKRMGLGLHGVRFHKQNPFRKFGGHSRLALVIKIAK